MGTNYAPLVADLFLFCHERDFMTSLSRKNQTDITEAFNSTSRYLDDLLNIDNIYFEHMGDRIYQAELQLNKANSSDTEAPFFFLFYLNLSISNGTVSTKTIMINKSILILIQLISPSSMVMSLGIPRIECTYLSFFVSLEHRLT